MTPDRFTRALQRLVVAGAGVVALHQVAYLLAHPSSLARDAALDGHGYLTPVAQALVPLTVAVATWAFAARSVGRAPVAPARLGSAADLAALFLLQETLERAVTGRAAADAFAEPAVWLGLALVPLVAAATRLLARAGARVAEATAVPPTVAPRRWSVAPVLPPAAQPAAALVPAPVLGRGPPASTRH